MNGDFHKCNYEVVNALDVAFELLSFWAFIYLNHFESLESYTEQLYI